MQSLAIYEIHEAAVSFALLFDNEIHKKSVLAFYLREYRKRRKARRKQSVEPLALLSSR